MTAPLLYGKYQLIDLIARGGMAEVYKAKSHGVEGFEKLVVIKRILPELSQDAAFVEMFIKEAKIAVTLSHANIVQVFDLGRSDDSYFIAMEYVHGLDLGELLARCRAGGRGMPYELAVYIVSEAAKGLDYAHRRRDQAMNPLGIVHRDVSPQNVLVSFEGEVKITDFGIAWAMGEAWADQDSVKGKARYMAPEQARAEEVDRRADIFALGVVLWEALAGRNPLSGLSDQEAIETIQMGGIEPLSSAAPDLPPELCDIVERAMSLDPEDRQPDAGRFYEELVAFLYTSRRRVGVNELATFTKSLEDVSRPRLEIVDRAERTLRESFAEVPAPTPTGLRTTSQATPIERPTGAPGPAPSEDGSGARRLPTELWDVTSLAWESLGVELPSSAAEDLCDVIEREGGHVVEHHDHFCVALFGLSVRDGRDTEAAVRCALKLQRLASRLRDRGAPGFEVGVGVHAGKVVMAPGERLPREDERYFQLLDAARIFASRRAGTVVVGDEAWRSTEDRFFYQSLGPGEWAVESERPLGEVYGRFVGRPDELRRIGEQLAYSNGGAGSVLFLTGEPGSGKTRLLHETRKRLTAGGHDFAWYQVRCEPHQRDLPYSGLSAMLREVLGLDEGDPEEKVREQVDRLRELGLGPEVVETVAFLLGAPGTERGDRSSQLDRELRVALLQVATKLAQDRLTVFCWDAAERMDRQTIDSLAALSHGATWSRVLVLLACRPPLSGVWNVLANAHTLDLGPLSDPDVTRLAAERIGVQELPEEFVRELVHKTAGNPLYVEEYVKALIAAGALQIQGDHVVYRPEVAEVEVPKSLRGLLGASFERLEPNLQGFLQRCAVMAPRFTVELLAAVAETSVEDATEAVEELWRLGILEQTARDEYAFVNEMLRDVVYDGITFSDRRAVHRKVAAEMERLWADRLEEVYDRLAHHSREGGQRDKAVEYLIFAADKLAAEAAHETAFWYYIRAVELAQTLPTPDHEALLDIYKRIGETAISAGLGDVAFERVRLGIELAEAVGDVPSTVTLLTLLGRLYDKAGRFGDAHRQLSQALGLSAELGDETVRQAVLGSIGQALSRNGEYIQATEYLEAALELARRADDKRNETGYLRELGLCWAARGQTERALDAIESATAAAAALGDRLLLCETAKVRGLVSYMVRDDDGALEAFEMALEMAKEYGFTYEIAANSHNVGDIQIRRGDLRAAFTALRFSHEVSRQHGFAKLESLNMMLLGFIDAVTFKSAEGIARIESALESAQANGYTWDAIQASYFLGKACLALGDVARARRFLREAVTMGRATDSRLYVEDCERLLETIEDDEG